MDRYLEFVESRCRPNTVLAAASDLKIFFSRPVKHFNLLPELCYTFRFDGWQDWVVARCADDTSLVINTVLC